MREAIQRFRELHEEYKSGAFKSPAALTFYESERDDFVRAVLQAQQLTLRPGQAVRQALRVNGAVNVELVIGARRENATTIDVGSAGFAATVASPLAVAIRCDFELHVLAGPVRGRARVVACVRDASSVYRTSFAIENMGDDDRKRLEESRSSTPRW